MKVKVIEDILRADSSGKEIAIRNGICDSTVSSIKHNISQLKYRPVIIEGQLVCTMCKKISQSLSFHHVHETGEVIALVCTSCNRKLKQNDLIPDASLELKPGRENGSYANVGSTRPTITFDLNEAHYKAILKGKEKGKWNTVSEALRTLVRTGFKDPEFVFLIDEM